MKKRNLMYRVLLITLPIITAAAYAETPPKFQASTEPVFSTPRAKPNIHMVLDDSGSMGGADVSLNGKTVTRWRALQYTVEALMRKYKDKAYLGISMLNQTGRSGVDTTERLGGVVRLKLADYSTYNIDTVWSYVQPLIRASGGTPVRPSVYETIKMFRGQEVSNKGSTETVYQKDENGNLVYVDKKDKNGNYIYFDKKDSNGNYIYIAAGDNKTQQRYRYNSNNGRYTQDNNGAYIRVQEREQETVSLGTAYTSMQLDTPLRYRCQQNHLVVMTDGAPSGDIAYGVAREDAAQFKSISTLSNSNNYVSGGVNHTQSVNLSSQGAVLGDLAANVDLRFVRKPVCDSQGRNCKEKMLDDAGKPWDDPLLSKKMPITMHSVSLQVDPKDKFYTDLTRASGGMSLGFASGGSAEQLLTAFDTIFASIILSTSSTLSMNDRIHSDMLSKPPKINTDGSVDLSSLGTIRYDTIYDFRQHFGSVRAIVPYKDSSKKNGIGTYELWNTDTSITPEQGRYVTLNGSRPGLELTEINKNVMDSFKLLKSDFHERNIDWLTNFRKNTDLGDLRARINPLGSVTNSEIVTANKDVLNINIAKDKMSVPLRKELTNWLLYKAKFQPKNFLIVGDNDGFINFINAQRGLTGNHKGGQRDTAYFPKMLVPRFDEIALANRPAHLIMEGKTDLVDANVYQSAGGGGEEIYATIGLTAMGGGGKGFVGYRIYAQQETIVDGWSADKKNSSHKPSADSIYSKVTPLFEITNEGDVKNRTVGFENLGYTYSGFEFFNRVIKDRTDTDRPQAVAVFGNGFGTDKSVLYFIDAYTGDKLHEIVLNEKGLGAGTPSLIIARDGESGGQKITRLYVGDYSGTLYKVEFATNDFTSDNAKITSLFKTPDSNYGQSAISVKPLVVKAKNSNMYRVFFGSGIAADINLDRYKNSLVTHAVYAINDLPDNANSADIKNASQKLASETSKVLTPILNVNRLRKGHVKYAENQTPNYEVFDKYDLSIKTPEDNPNDTSSALKNSNGWYMILSSDNPGIIGSMGVESEAGTIGSGERVILDPQYDSINDVVVFSTWGIKERDSRHDSAVDDPCVTDLSFGKVLAFYTTTGGGAPEISIANKGTTGTAMGSLTGDGVESAPEGNEATKLSDLNQEDKTELLETVDKLNSSYETDSENSGVYCVGGIDGKSECVEIKRFKVTGSKPVRVSVQTRVSS